VDGPGLIAVVGLAGRFPMAGDIGEYWQNLMEGRECLHEIDDDELLARGEVRERIGHPSYVRRRPLLVGMEDFDAGYFAMTPKEAELRDPQHRLFLETSHAALEHAGYDSLRFDGGIGVYGGVNGTRYADLHIREHPDLVEAVGDMAIETSTNTDYLCTFTSYKLGLRGPSLTISTACSTSLVAIHHACQALRRGECDMALAGGVEIEWPYGIGYIHRPGHILSPDGSCRPFDVDAAGTNFSSGVGVVVLKRYEDAVADRDTVYSVVRGSAVNNDGFDKVGFTAPSVSGQRACIAEALVTAGVEPSSIDYVEAHGTATKVGDPIEVEALTEAFNLVGAVAPQACGLGSVKGNIGHLGPAAGVASFIKVTLALGHGTIPPSINFVEPNPALHLEETPFRVVSRPEPWPRRDGDVRRAGISSFGVGGTNAHLVLEEPPAPAGRPAEAERPRLVLWSAKTAAAEERLRNSLAEHLAWNEVRLDDVAFALATGRRRLPVRGAVVTSSVQETVAALETARAEELEPPSNIVFAFPGQGSQLVRMGYGLYEANEDVRRGIDLCLDRVEAASGRRLRELWLSGSAEELAQTAVAQPLLFAVEFVLANVLADVIGSPAAVLGHSVGELVAGVVAGVFSFEDGLRAVVERGRLMQEMPSGAMLATFAGLPELGSLELGDVHVAAVNAERQVVLAGDGDAIAAAARTLAEAGLESKVLKTSHAYHSPSMAEASSRFADVLAGMSLRPPEIPLLSAAAGTFVDGRAAEASFWADQLVQPVRFADAVGTLASELPGSLVLEVGPGDALCGLIRASGEVRSAGTKVRPVLGRAEPGSDEWRAYLATLGYLWQCGRDIRWDGLDEPAARRLALPIYPFERKRFFVDRRTGADASETSAAEGTAVAEAAGQPARSEQPDLARAPRERAGAQLFEVGWTPRASVPASLADALGAPAAPALTLVPAGQEPPRKLLLALQRARLDPVLFEVPPDEGRNVLFPEIERRARAGELPTTVVHALELGDEVTPLAVDSVLAVHQAMQRFRAEARLSAWRLVVLTRRAADVSGGEPLRPERWMLSGLLRSLEREVQSLRCHFVDVSDRTTTDELAAALLTLDDPIVAVRGRSVWLPSLRRWEPASSRPRLRRRGVYLITGAFGALGFVAARALAGTGLEPRLVLVGRSGPDTDGAAAAIAELERRGAEVEALAADVSRPADVRRVLKRARLRFGPVNGVLNAAGVPGDGLAELRTPEQVESVLRPKLAVGPLQELAAADGELDFAVHFSSRAALEGLVGSADYAAANAYLDAHARASADGDAHVVSINWPAWSEIGMAARGVVVPPTAVSAPPNGDARPGSSNGRHAISRALAASDWIVDEHRVGGRPVVPGTAYVELITAAAAETGLVEPGAPLQLRDLVIVAPLVVDPSAEVRVRFEAEQPPAVAYVEALDERNEWVTHVQAVVASAEEQPVDIDPTYVFDQLEQGEEVAGVGASGFVAFGPRWANVERAARLDDVLVAKLRLPEPFREDLAEHSLHPALLDNATALIHSGAEGVHLPFLYREAVFFRPLPPELLSVASLRESPGRHDVVVGDIDLYGVGGEHLARIDGFTMRAVETNGAAAATTRGASAPKPDDVAPSGLSPADGVVALLRAIESDAPPNLLVLPPDVDVATVGHVVEGESAPRAHRPAEPPVDEPRPAVDAAVSSDQPTPQSLPMGANGSARERLHALFVEVLGDPGVGEDDDFFAAGGSSLAGVQLISRIRDTFGVELSVGVLFEKPTIGELGGELERMTA
jgi:phthiocerol/phenolphthiocerol synthesis type-I polyketide synthase E